MMLELKPCIVTQVTPLLIQYGDETPHAATKIAGTDVVLGAANALVPPVGNPVVLPIGV